MKKANKPNILREIVKSKKTELIHSKIDVPFDELESRTKSMPSPLNFGGALLGNSVRIIAEIKRASPTKGLLNPDIKIVELADLYTQNGAAAISVLTNTEYFKGTLDDLKVVGNSVNPRGIPVLRKEFIFDAYQIYEARANGADAVLLIVSILSPQLLKELLTVSQDLWMQTLVEIHNENELEIALAAGAEIIGINNRDLSTFTTDINITERIAPKIPKDKIVVSESGIGTTEDINRVRKVGVNAVLIGEKLVRSADPAQTLRELV